MTKGFTDVHQHLLYGLDDGPDSKSEMYEMLRAAARDGVQTVYATPHVTPGLVQFDGERMRERLSEANEYCLAEGLALRVLPGAEILYTPALDNAVVNQPLPTLGETKCALVEFSPGIRYAEIERAAKLLNRRGYFPMLAHLERLECFRKFPSNLARLKENCRVYYQLNCESLLGLNGYLTKRFVWRLLRSGEADCVASDAHGSVSRPIRMLDAYRALEKELGETEAERLMGIGQPLPPC